MSRIFVKPAPGMLVRKPIGGHLAADGEWQNLDSYWQRRINDADVAEVPGMTEDTGPAAPAPAASPAPAQSKAAAAQAADASAADDTSQTATSGKSR